jgi:hypothetical protein
MRAPQPTKHDTPLAMALPHPAMEIRDTATLSTPTPATRGGVTGSTV